jgi:hypothetical protein
MAPNAPYLPPNPLRPRAFGGKGAEGMNRSEAEIVCRKAARRVEQGDTKNEIPSSPLPAVATSDPPLRASVREAASEGGAGVETVKKCRMPPST